jgi:hypothetical protein
MRIRTLGVAIALTMVAGVAAARDSSTGGFASDADHQFLRAPEYTPVSSNEVGLHTTVGATSVGATTGAVSAPEIDPASGIAGIMLMIGTLAVLRGRRATQP